MHHVQFRSASMLYNLVDAAASVLSCHKGTVNDPLQKAVPFRYRNFVTAVKYLLRHKAYAADMLWRPHHEYDDQCNQVYIQINTGTCWQNTQVSDLTCRI